MKTNFKLILILLLALNLANCTDNTEKKQVEQQVLEKPDFRAYLLEKSKTNQKTGETSLYTVRTEADFVKNTKDSCQIVNIRVYVKAKGTKFLVANDNIKVGGCGEEKPNKNQLCEGYLRDGNYVYENANDDEICLYELLTENKDVYDKYRVSLTKLIKNHN